MRNDGFVYFIRCVGTPFVKIGFTRGRPEARVAALQVGCPLTLAVSGTDYGPPSLERHYHYRFRKCRIHGEWFAMNRELSAFVAEMEAERASWAELAEATA